MFFPYLEERSISSEISLFLIRRLSDIFKKGKRHFRKTLRGRSDDQDGSGSSSASSSTPSVSGGPAQTGGVGAAVADKKSLPSMPYPPLPVGGAGGSGSPSSQGGRGTLGSSPSGEDNVKDRIQQWIQQQAAGFLEKWAGPSHSNPAHQVVARLKEAAQGLDPKSPSCLTSLTVRNCPFILCPDYLLTCTPSIN